MTNIVVGDENAQQLAANMNKTQVYGVAGNDTLVSENFSDVLLIGGSGDDSLIMRGGNGTLSGGDGSDVFELNYSATEKLSAVIEDFEPARDKIIVNFDGETVPQLSSVVSGDDVIWRDGDLLTVTLKGVRENDYYDGTASEQIWQVLKLTNDEREKQNLSLLTMSDGLTAGAEIRVDEIKTLGNVGPVTDHSRPEGKNGDWLEVFNELGIAYINVGENLDAGATSPEQVLKQWMDSEDHRDNILNPIYKKLGVGYINDDPDPTNHRFYWTQWFAEKVAAPESVSTAELLSAQIDIVNTPSRFFTLTEGDDTFANTLYGATVDALGGNDTVTNSQPLVKISGGTGDDLISLGSAANNNVIDYSTGDGNDIVFGFNETDTLKISGDEYTPVTVGSDIVVNVSGSSVTLVDAATVDANIDGTWSKVYILTEGDDTFENTVDSVTIQALGGNDFVTNTEIDVEIHGDDGDDDIYNYGANVTIGGDNYEDILVNYGANVTIGGGDGSDTVYNEASEVSIDGGNDNDSIRSVGYGVSIGGSSGNDTISNIGSEVSIDGGNGNDTISNASGDYVLVNGGTGNDTIGNGGHLSTVNGDAGNDVIINVGSNTTISGGADNDEIIFHVNSQSNLIDYAAGDGLDTVFGFDLFDTLRIGDGTGTYSTRQNGNDIIVNVSTGFVILLNAASLSAVNIVGTQREASEDELFIRLTDEDDIYGNTVKSAIILALGGADSVDNTGDNVIISGDTGNDSVYNSGNFVIIGAEDDNDLIDNVGNAVIIDGGSGNDSVFSTGNEVSIEGGTGDDLISLASGVQNNRLYYRAGDGNDTVSGLDINAGFVSISTEEYTRSTVGNDVIVAVGTDSITFLDAANSYLRIYSPMTASDVITLTEFDDSYSNRNDAVTIAALGGNDFIHNNGAGVSISGNADDDTVINNSSDVTVDAGAGNDDVSNLAANVTISGNVGTDRISNYSAGANVSVTGGDGSDRIYNYGDSVTIDGGGGNDYIENYGLNVIVAGSNGADSILNVGSDASIDGGDDDDIIENYASNVSITAGTGNDMIGLSSIAENNFVNYTDGDGDDTLWGWNSNLKINISAATYSSVASGDDIILRVGTGSIKLVDARDKPLPDIIGASNSAGGTSNNDGGNNNSDGKDNSGDDGGKNNDSAEGNSQADSDGRSTSGAGNTSGGGRSRDGGGGSVRTATSTRPGYTNVIPTAAPTSTTTSTTSTSTTTTTPNQIYTGGNQVITNYTSGQAITFNANYTGAVFDNAGNFFVGSTTGALVIQNAVDKVIDLRDGNGNEFMKAYSSSTPGVIDGRGLNGFQLINGSAGSDIIQAGDGGSQLWGGNDTVTDALLGGNGTDIFVTGKSFGADAILNASADDLVNFADSNLSDIVATAGDGNSVGILFNSGNVVTVQSTDVLSSAFMLADGSAYRYNHVTKAWQQA